MKQSTELAMLRKIVRLAKTVQDHYQFPPRGGRCWCEMCEAIRCYDAAIAEENAERSARIKAVSIGA